MWVWQSQAPAGTSKFTGVDGCDALARAFWRCMVIPTAMEASRTLRRLNIISLPVFYFQCAQDSTFHGASTHAAELPPTAILLPGRSSQAMPGIAYLMVMHLGQIVWRVESERPDVEPANRAEQCIGGDRAIALRAYQPRFGRNQVGLRVQDVDGSALAARGFLLHALERDGCRANFRFRCRHRDLGAFIGSPGADGGGPGLIANLVEHHAALRRQFFGLAGLRCRGAAVVDRCVHLGDDRSLIGS